MFTNELSRRALLRWGMIGAGGLALPGVLAACGGGSSSVSSAAGSTTESAGAGDGLLAAAKKEGSLNLPAVTVEKGTSFQAVLDGFKKSSGLKVDPLEGVLDSPGSQMGEVKKISGKPNRLDVLDVGLTSALEATRAGLVEKFVPDGWEDIPSAAKDANGMWLSSYYVLVGIVSNTSMLKGAQPPATFAELAKLPDGVTMGFPGDPRSPESLGDRSILAGSAAFGAVWTAALAQGGSLDDISPGIDLFADLAKRGIFKSVNDGGIITTKTAGQGTVGVMVLDTSAIAMAQRLATKANELVLRIDPTGRLFPNYYAQAVVKGAPHPNAAKLWLQYLVSDQGSTELLDGGQVPTRFPVMERAGTVNADDLKNFSDVGLSAEKLSAKLAAVQIPTVAQMQKAQAEVDRRWGPEVAGEKS